MSKVTRDARACSARNGTTLAWLVVTMTLGASCARQQRPEARTWAPVGTTHVAPPAKVLPDLGAPDVAPFAARELAVAVSALSEGHRPDHSNISRSFEKLADVLAILAPRQAVDLDWIRRMARVLSDSREDSMLHADATRIGLEAAARILASISPRQPSPRPLKYPDMVRAFVRAVELLDPEAPLLEQHPLVISAFEAATRAVYLAFGVEAPVLGPVRAVQSLRSFW